MPGSGSAKEVQSVSAVVFKHVLSKAITAIRATQAHLDCFKNTIMSLKLVLQASFCQVTPVAKTCSRL